MKPLEPLLACAGSWRGTNTLQDPTTGAPEETPATATVTPVLGGRFVRLDYTWAYQGDPKEGSLLIGWEHAASAVTAYLIDSWHLGDLAMTCRGDAGPGDAIDVLGSYAAPPGPDWGWRVIITPDHNRSLRMVMNNIWPDGREELAVEAAYTREE